MFAYGVVFQLLPLITSGYPVCVAAAGYRVRERRVWWIGVVLAMLCAAATVGSAQHVIPPHVISIGNLVAGSLSLFGVPMIVMLVITTSVQQSRLSRWVAVVVLVVALVASCVGGEFLAASFVDLVNASA